jgi:hypothetical protein
VSSSSIPEPTAKASIDLTKAGWFEVEDSHDEAGHAARTVLAGTLDGVVSSETALGNSTTAGNSSAALFDWTGPQADGVFGGQVLLWGRDGDVGAIEMLAPTTGAISPVVAADAAVQVATADGPFATVFFITADPVTRVPIALWMYRTGSLSNPQRLDVALSHQPVDAVDKYRLAADEAGDQLALQRGDGPITIIDIAHRTTTTVTPFGPMIGFAGGSSITLGAKSGEGHRPLMAFRGEGPSASVLLPTIDAAQVLGGSTQRLIAAMITDPNDPRKFEIGAVNVDGVVRWPIFRQTAEAQAATLAPGQRPHVVAELPDDWVLVADSFLPFIQEPIRSKSPEASTFPFLVNVVTSEVERLGPFARRN